MSHVDVAVRGGTLVLPDGTHEGDVGIVAGRIAAIGVTGSFEAVETIEARGLHVFPGVIDPHAHPGNLRPFELDIAEETRACATGGITTIVGTVKAPRMGQPIKEVTTAADVCSYHDVFSLACAAIDEHSHVDVGLSYVVMDDRHAREIPEYVARHGVCSFKFFIGNRGPQPWSGRVGMPVYGDDGVPLPRLPGRGEDGLSRNGPRGEPAGSARPARGAGRRARDDRDMVAPFTPAGSRPRPSPAPRRSPRRPAHASTLFT